jgi:hypothetical protein
MICMKFNILDRAVYDRQPYSWIVRIYQYLEAEGIANRNKASKAEMRSGTTEAPWPV